MARTPDLPESALQRLVDRTLIGDLDAFAELFTYSRHVFVAMLRAKGCPLPDIDDFIHDAFTRVLQTLPRSDSLGMTPREFEKWLTSIVRNRFIDAQRRSAVRRKWENEQKYRTEKHFEAASAGEEEGHPHWLRRAFDKMTPAVREAAWLRFIEDLKPREIAAALDISPEAARQRLRAAREHLRRAYRDEGE